MTLHKGSPLLSEMFFALCKAVDTPFSLGAWLRFKYDHKSFTDLDIHPRDYETATSFKGDYLVYSYLSKYKGLDTGYDLEATALQKFSSSEDACSQTNERIRKSRVEGLPALVRDIIPMARNKIARLLGPFATWKVQNSYGWGPGATADISRRRAFVDTKLSQIPLSVTRRALPVIRQEISTDLHWSGVLLGVDVDAITGPFCFLPHIFSVKEECVIDTVPKNSKTHRVIAKEATCNGFLQKGFGAYFRSRLKRVGINLDDQGDNQRAAKAAVKDCLATLDLKAASDTVALELVYELLPVDWALALDDVRSHRATLPGGEEITLQKFSSMGNGFTFELESLIFWSLAASVSEVFNDSERVWVYGDDLVIHQHCAPQLVEVLSWAGFTVNSEKSFFEGVFFESCGKHYFDGTEVTPIYQKEVIDHDQELIRGANRLVRCAHRFGGYNSLDKRIYTAWARAWRARGSSGIFQLPLGTEGDDGWVLPADYFALTPQNPNLGLRCRVIAPVQATFPGREDALLAWTLRRGVITSEPFYGDVTSSPGTTKSSTLRKGGRWVMPTWEFGLSW